MTRRRMVTLEGGPFTGSSAEVLWPHTLTLEGPGVPEGRVARYRPSLRSGVYTFRGFATVLARLPEPGARL